MSSRRSFGYPEPTRAEIDACKASSTCFTGDQEIVELLRAARRKDPVYREAIHIVRCHERAPERPLPRHMWKLRRALEGTSIE